MSKPERLLIVGGVAGGAACATRARRLSEHTQIIIFERGPYVSFANCGLPYYVGNVITKEDDLLVATPELFHNWFNIEVRTGHNVHALLRDEKEIEVEDLSTGKRYRESYDALMLAPGSIPLRPGIPGIDLPGIFTLKSIPDTREIRSWITSKDAKKATIVGGGFIGLEMAENLNRRGLDVTIIEMLGQVMPNMDAEMAAVIHDHLDDYNIKLCLGSPVSRFEATTDGTIELTTADKETVTADVVILAMGVRPENRLAKSAGLAIGALGGISVDDQMRTSDKHIWAAGDAVEVDSVITGEKTLVPLAGPAGRQGRIAADSMMGATSDSRRFRGVQATAVCGLFDLTIASTGLSEKALKNDPSLRLHEDYEKIYLHPFQHASYYPNAKSITIKLLFDLKDGRILGAQAVGYDGVEKRIDVIAMAIQKNGTVFDLEEAELCYAPQYGSARDPINMAGMIAANIMRGQFDVVHWEEMPESGAFLLDVRSPIEARDEPVPNTVNIPLYNLRKRLDELPRDREIITYCLQGQRSYFAARILIQNGFKARNLSGGYMTRELRPEIDSD